MTDAVRAAAAMREALALAERGRFRVEPNPPVGAVVLDAGGAVVGRGFHAVWGGPHAEVHALDEAGERARGGTLVVTLEPCAHTSKKTPPCVERVVRSGVDRVVVGAVDANPATHRRAASILAAAGVETVFDVEQAACERALERYAAWQRSPRAWLVAKWAQSLDGRTADESGRSQWVSCAGSRRVVHAVRAAADAVLVGAGTVAADDPRLTARDVDEPPARGQPLRVVLDTRLRSPPDAHVFTDGAAPTLVVTTDAADGSRRRALESRGVDVRVVPAAPDGRVDVCAACELLHAEGRRRVLVEAGARLTGALLRAGAVEQVMAFVAPKLLGGAAPGPVGAGGDPGWSLDRPLRIERMRVVPVDADLLVEGYVAPPGAGTGLSDRVP